jgi:hypothetical protein
LNGGHGQGFVPSTSGYSVTSGHEAVDPDIEAQKGYWKTLEHVEVGLVQQKEGWFLQKYHVESDVSDDDIWYWRMLTGRRGTLVSSLGGIAILHGF